MFDLARIGFVSLVLALAAPAAAQLQDEDASDFTEKLEIGISTDEISITSDFRGADLTIFGAIDGFDGNLLAQGKYNIIVTLEGPKENATVRKKQRVFGIWVNTSSMTFELVPESYSLSSTRDIETIAPPGEMGNMGIGVDHMRLVPLGFVGDGSNLGEFRNAFRQIRETSGVYQRDPGGVQFISSSLFKASVRLPANVPNGVHIVRAYLFRDGVFVAAKALPLRVVKTGLEQAITRAAHDQPVIYGLVAVLLAVITGWGASLLFRKE
ncbi:MULTISPECIES: TIGR02186 family protein [Sinorhizobium]|uniref:TIGR02186 family protein n=1 Tax=Sinorhizobium psoraleae TaxID=520838 RepID=A0ABT4KEM0_9HYPH|nr:MULTISPECIES: TIGR02186 family protein [Sinorhizobium]MCZ4090413.1 TIGR02186 family protein [Sinorhizobium psoraleae]MDK1384260.1 TIGR02186 family protein [Sinorhizobium sp. 7-81]MDK1493309.1 TIGR02186 family protein [Sinorhizobium sp. 8-89]